jgi:hypothetical protein
MKVELLRLNTANKPSPISEGVIEIQINTQPCKSINLTTWHTQVRRTQRVATVHDTVKESGWVLPHPSAVFHAYASTDTPWVARHYPVYIHKEVGYRPTRWHVKLLSLRIPYVLYAPVHSMPVHQGLIDVGLNWHRRGLQPWSSEYQIRPLILLPIQYSPFSPNCPARSPFMPFYQVLNIPLHEPGYKSTKSREWSLSLDFYWNSIH